MRKQEERIYLTFNYPEYVSGSKTLLTGIEDSATAAAKLLLEAGIRGKGKTLYIRGFYEESGSKTISFFYKGDLRGTIGPCSDNSWNILD